MLQQLRDKTQGWITRVIIGVVCVAFIGLGVHSFIISVGMPAGSLAKVGDHTVTKTEFDSVYNRLREEQRARLGANFKMTDQMQQSLQQAAMQQLVSSIALSQAALKQDFRFSPEQVGHVIAGISAFQEDGKFSPAKFQQALLNLGYSEQDFFDNIRNAMLINQLRIGVVGSSFAMPYEAHQALQLVNQKRDIAYVTLSPQDYINKVQVTDQETQGYYQKHQQQFTTPESVTVQYLELSLPELAKRIKPTDAELQQYYQSNMDSFSVPAKWRLAMVLLPTNAAAQAQTVSQSLASSSDVQAIAQKVANAQGQTTDWVNSKELSPDIVSALSKTKVKEVTPPIQTPNGLLIAKVLAYQASSATPFAQVKEQVAAALATQKASQQFADMSDKLNSLTYTNATSLDPAAKALDLTVQTSDTLVNNQPGKGVFSNPKVIAAAFASDVIAGNNSNVISLDDQHLVVLHVAKHQASQVKPFADVKPEIMTGLREQKAKALAEAKAQEIITAVGQNKTLAQVAGGLKVTQQSNISRYTAGANATVMNAAFQMPRPGKSPAISEFAMPNGDIAVVQVLQVHQDSSSNTPVQQRVMDQQIANGFAQLEYQYYVEGVLAKSNIKINQAQDKKDEQ